VPSVCPALLGTSASTSPADKTGARAASSARDAAQRAELIILVVPYSALRSVLANLGSSVGGKVIVDVTHPLDATFTGLTSETSAAEEVQALAPRRPTEGNVPLDAFYAGDDAAAKAQVAELALSLAPAAGSPTETTLYQSSAVTHARI
jgi:predicted dinucleotide-binding enzyme